eukprot:CAMPEP_0204246402 /NCGR_PEP_ID=MMETSP0361-20130328/98122_1 /ASSEMBLY_ACC=CAM_ASM_000343 /TAXON_ID=268821 /ORGANISM="Scrippsiella Hangoei, Strain SHTV-5" /LENGTH=635 /DNA_ID=CAMNT_0051219619 /DNA_START=74 /DNA_END=1979 /DNA_ORIENTATION=-
MSLIGNPGSGSLYDAGSANRKVVLRTLVKASVPGPLQALGNGSDVSKKRPMGTVVPCLIALPVLAKRSKKGGVGSTRLDFGGETRQERALKRSSSFGTFQPQATRGQMSVLEQASVSDVTQSGYLVKLELFEQFAADLQLPLDSGENIDMAMVDYLDQIFLDGADMDDATRLYAAVVLEKSQLWEKRPHPFVAGEQGPPRLEKALAYHDSCSDALDLRRPHRHWEPLRRWLLKQGGDSADSAEFLGSGSSAALGEWKRRLKEETYGDSGAVPAALPVPGKRIKKGTVGRTCLDFGGETRLERALKRSSSFGTFQPQATRGQMSVLEQASVSDVTQAGYLAKLELFEQFAADLHLPLDSGENIDKAMVDYLDQIFLDGADMDDATRLYAAWCWRNPGFGRNGHIRLSRVSRALQGRKKVSPTTTRAPMPWIFAALIATRPGSMQRGVGETPVSGATGTSAGRGVSRALQGWKKLSPTTTRAPMLWIFAALIATQMVRDVDLVGGLALITMIPCYLRPGEAMRLKEADLVRPTPPAQLLGDQLAPVEPRRVVKAPPQRREPDARQFGSLEPWHLPRSPEDGGARPASVQVPVPERQEVLRECAGEVWSEESVKYVMYQATHGGPSHDRRNPPAPWSK